MRKGLRESGNYKTKAYTLIEVIITVFLIGIVIYFSFSIIVFLNSMVRNYQREYMDESNVLMFCEDFNRELYEAKTIEQNGNYIIFKSGYGDSTAFRFKENQILKYNYGKWDSIDLKINISTRLDTIENRQNWNFRLIKKQPKEILEFNFVKTVFITDSLFKTNETK